MYSDSQFRKPIFDVKDLIRLNDRLNTRVVEKVNRSQELCSLASSKQESNEYHIRKSLEERISCLTAWCWVLQDLSKRLDGALEALNHEREAILAVRQRLDVEITYYSEEKTQPGVLSPLTDTVENIIIKEHKFLKLQKAMFEDHLVELSKLIATIEKTKRRIEDDLKAKELAMAVEEACVKTDIQAHNSARNFRSAEQKVMRKRNPDVPTWERRCRALKACGLAALEAAAAARARFRGARKQLSCEAQAYALRVDNAIRKRLHNNMVKLNELIWQSSEAERDLKNLEEERISTEQSIREITEYMRLVQVRQADRANRPRLEDTNDDVDRLLRADLAQMKRNVIQLQENFENIKCLQRNLMKIITEMDKRSADILHLVRLDDARIQGRRNEDSNESAHRADPQATSIPSKGNQLNAIAEETEDGSYPFDF